LKINGVIIYGQTRSAENRRFQHYVSNIMSSLSGRFVYLLNLCRLI